MSKKKKDKLVMPKLTPTKTTTKTPTGEEAFGMTHQEVNFGNVERTKLMILGNINTTLLDILRELKKSNGKSS